MVDRDRMIKSLALYVYCAKNGCQTRESCCSDEDYHIFLQKHLSLAETIKVAFGFAPDEELVPLDKITLSQDDYYEIVEQVFTLNRFPNMVSLPVCKAPAVEIKNQDKPFFDNYISKVINNDERTKVAVDETIERINKILSTRDAFAQRLSGLVVGRVQSGKTRNYIGLMLKAIDEGWNVIVVLTSDNVALATQTRERVAKDFTASGITRQNSFEVSFLENTPRQTAAVELDKTEGIFFFWGVAMKEKSSLKRLGEWFTSNRQFEDKMRVLIIDDEADNATPDSRANLNNHLTPEELENLYYLLDADEDGEIKDLAYWLLDLEDKEFPELPADDEIDTEEQKTYRELKSLLGQTTSKREAFNRILNANKFRQMLNIEGTDNGGNTFNHLQAIEKFFLRQTRGEHSPGHFVKALNSVLDIAISRSTINRSICTLVDKAQGDAQYSYKFQKCAYIGYTATPYACILNERPDQTTLYPDFIFSLEKSPQYFGLEEIYGEEVMATRAKMDIVRSILPVEMRRYLSAFQGGRKSSKMSDGNDEENIFTETNGDNSIEGWTTMKDAIAWAFCTAAARRYHRSEYRRKVEDRDDLTAQEKEEKVNALEQRWTTMLVNITHKKNEHHKLCGMIKDYVRNCCKEEVSREAFFTTCKELWAREGEAFSKATFGELFPEYGEIADYPGWSQLEENLKYFVSQWNDVKVHVIAMNSDDRRQQETYTQDPKKLAEGEITQYDDDNLWIICGGNTISRGLTLAGLTTSYFERVRKTMTVDTMTQMGRWFGYRAGYELLPRIWMLPDTITEMKKTAILEDRMHAMIRSNFTDGFSPADPEHYQIIYSYGRKLSGRARAQAKHTERLGSQAATHHFLVEPDILDKAFTTADGFIRSLGTFVARRKEEYYYSYIPCWENVSTDKIVRFVKDMREFYPNESKTMLESLLREIEGNSDVDMWDVTVGSVGKPDLDEDGENTGRTIEIGGVTVRSGRQTCTAITSNAVRLSGSGRMYSAYYAMIPTRCINAVDVQIFGENYNEIEATIAEKTKANNDTLPWVVERDFEQMGVVGDTWQERLRNLRELLENDPSKNLPNSIHTLFRYFNDGYRNRSAIEYMGRVHRKAHHQRPILQVYLITPPAENGLNTEKPLVSVAFYWPDHASDGFYEVSVRGETEVKNPTLRQFYAAVEKELREYDFPMTTNMLRSNVIRAVNCTERFFSDNIQRDIERQNYMSVSGYNAYSLRKWSDDPEARLQRELLRGAVEVIKASGDSIRRDKVLELVLNDNTKLSHFFPARSSKAKQLLASLLTEQVMKENLIQVVSRNPLTYQYLP